MRFSCRKWTPPPIFLRSIGRKGINFADFITPLYVSPMETTTGGKNDLEQWNSTLKSDFISTRIYFITIIGPRKLYSGCDSLLPKPHEIALKGFSSGGFHSFMISNVACWFRHLAWAFCVRFHSFFFGCSFCLAPQSTGLKCFLQVSANGWCMSFRTCSWSIVYSCI